MRSTGFERRGAAVACAAALALGGACAWLPGAGPEEAEEAERGNTRAAMGEILEALGVALPLSLSEARLREPEDRAALERAARTLARNAEALEDHGGDRSAGFAFLSGRLAGDARDVVRRLERDRPEEARFLLQQLVDNCVACHSRLPGDARPLGERLLADLDARELAPAERARLLVATRQFDRALSAYEALFRDPERDPAQFDFQGLLADYLVVAVRVRGELPRARETLEALARREDVPLYLRRTLESWTLALEELPERPEAGSPLERARSLLEAGARRSGDPMDRASLVHQIRASGLLHRYVRAHPDPSPETAEAYYLLGLTETNIGRSYWLSQAEHYLETAIRMAPGSETAERAYALLERETLAGYSGSSGLHLPTDVLRRLEELRGLAQGGAR